MFLLSANRPAETLKTAAHMAKSNVFKRCRTAFTFKLMVCWSVSESKTIINLLQRSEPALIVSQHL